jgi:hypothetical protein
MQRATCECCGEPLALLPPVQPTQIEAREWNGHPIQRRQMDGYVNATAMCKANGKHLPHYLANGRTTEYLQALAGSVGIPTDLLKTSIGTGPNHLRGAWIHPRMAVDLARWISPSFAVWMDGWFLEQLEQAKQQQPTIVCYAIDPRQRRRALLSERGAAMRSLWDLGPSERNVIRQIHCARNVSDAGHDCRTGDLMRELAGDEWRPGTIRWAIGRVRRFGLIVKRGRSWHLTERGAALAERDERELA